MGSSTGSSTGSAARRFPAAPGDPLTVVEPEPPLIRFTQQNPGIGPDFGVLIVCAGGVLTARIRTITPVYGALAVCPGSAAEGSYAGPLTLQGQRVGGYVIIRPLNRVSATAAVPTG